MEETNWYAVYTVFRAEKRVKERLDQAGIENYLPLRMVERAWGDRVMRIEVPLISGCVFVCVSETDFIKVLSTSGVVSFLRESESPAIIPDKQIECLRVINDNTEDIEVLGAGIPAGLIVRVARGKLVGLEGELIESLENHRILVRVWHWGGVLTTVQVGCVEPV